MLDEDERDIIYMRGKQMAARQFLRVIIETLKEDGGPDFKLAVLVDERLEVLAKLRELCEEYGDNDWPDNLHPADVIEKHLVRPLYEELEGQRG